MGRVPGAARNAVRNDRSRHESAESRQGDKDFHPDLKIGCNPHVPAVLETTQGSRRPCREVSFHRSAGDNSKLCPVPRPRAF